MSEENQIPNPRPQGHVSCQQVSAKAFAAKFKSKRECYTFLAGECEVYLPPYGKFRFHFVAGVVTILESTNVILFIHKA